MANPGKSEGAEIVIPTSVDPKMETEDQQEKDKIWMEKYGLAMDQLAELKESFTMFDREEEGMILAGDFSHAVRALGQSPTEAECNELLQDIDLSESGKISMDEFIRVMGQRGMKSEPEMEEELEEAMRVFDKLGNGYCEAEELKNVLRTLGEQLEEEDINEMIKLAEVDKEGRINYLEFVRKLTTK